MSEQDDNSVLSRVSISTGVIPFPSMDSSLLLHQNLSTLKESSTSSGSEPMLHPSTSSPALPEPHEGSSEASDGISTLPFPTNPPISNNGSPSPRPELPRSDSTSYSVAQESHVTASSSRMTSSDKLSALPSSMGPNVTRKTRSPTFAALTNFTRGFRRSLDDASASLPSFSMAEQDSRVVNHSIWGAAPSYNTRTETGSNSGVLERHPTPENASTGTPKQRVSFDSDPGSLPTTRSVGQAFLRPTRSSDPHTTSPASGLRSSANLEHRDHNVDSSSNVQVLGSRSQSPRHSRPTSPLRAFQRWSSGLLGYRASVEEPFVPVDPFKLHYHFPFCCCPHTHDIESGDGSAFSDAYECDDLIPVISIKSFLNNTRFFFVDTLPRQIYLHFLLHLPAMYFTRVSRIFEDAEVSRPDIQRMIDALGRGGTAMAGPGMTSTLRGNNGTTTGRWEPNILAQSTPPHIPMTTFSPSAPRATTGFPQAVAAPVPPMIRMPLPFPDEWSPPLVSPALIRFKHSWEAFIDSLMREWKTLNVVSALLASTILTIFQVPQAGNDPVTRTAAFLSLICALMSLSYGCMYIVRFGMMRNMFHASRWAEEAQKTNTSILWNVWVLLAMPAVWMAWAMVLFLASILSFVWRTGGVSDPSDPPPLSDQAALGPRILITSVLFLGLGYMAMIVLTLKNYGSYELPTRASANMGMGMRNIIQGGGIPTHGDTTGGQGGATDEKNIRARDIDAAMERRGRQRERTISRVRRKEEDVEQRQHAGPSVADSIRKGGGNSKGMHGLGFGGRFNGELEELSEALKIDGLP